MLGQGVYILSEVARLTETNPARIRWWFKPRSDKAGRGPVFESDYTPVDGDFAVSFLDLIDTLVVAKLREAGVKMHVIRRAHSALRQRLSTEHPFAHSDLYTDGQEILTRTATEIGDDKLTGVVSNQGFFIQFKNTLGHVDYSRDTRLARRWRIVPGIMVDPGIAMGKPTIENTGVTTLVISNQYYANSEDAGLVADLYGITEADVANAVKFESWHGRGRAA